MDIKKTVNINDSSEVVEYTSRDVENILDEVSKEPENVDYKKRLENVQQYRTFCKH